MENTKLLNKLLNKLTIKEDISKSSGLIYENDTSERLPDSMVRVLRDRKHSLGAHPIFPESDESHFEEKIISKRFDTVLKSYKRHFDVDTVDDLDSVMRNSMESLKESMVLEKGNESTLEELAEKIIREEYDMSEDDVEIICKLTPRVSLEGTIKNPTPEKVDVVFDSHDEIVNANKEVYKRRFINAMIQGAAKKTNQMFHMVDEELSEINPQLPTKYSKLMSSADYMYFEIDAMDNGISGGKVKVTFPSKEGEKPIIEAEAMVFPVLIHELTKGVMEILSSHGLPQKEEIRTFVINKSDYLSAEPWDMRLGPGLWEKFIESIENVNDFNLKHHLYSEICTLPVDEFNDVMKEIMSGTKRGKEKVKKILHNIKQELILDSYNDVIGDEEDNDYSGF